MLPVDDIASRSSDIENMSLCASVLLDKNAFVGRRDALAAVSTKPGL